MLLLSKALSAIPLDLAEHFLTSAKEKLPQVYFSYITEFIAVTKLGEKQRYHDLIILKLNPTGLFISLCTIKTLNNLQKTV